MFFSLQSVVAAAAAALGRRTAPRKTPPRLQGTHFAAFERRVADPARRKRRAIIAQFGRRQGLKIIKAQRRAYKVAHAG